jgi:hypothetical protein
MAGAWVKGLKEDGRTWSYENYPSSKSKEAHEKPHVFYGKILPDSSSGRFISGYR